MRESGSLDLIEANGKIILFGGFCHKILSDFYSLDLSI
jgi:hypothetical protein